MKRKLQKFSLMALLTTALLPLGSLAADDTKDQSKSATSSADQAGGAAAVAVQPGVPGGIVVQTFEQTATVTDIDKDKRKVTLQTPDGKVTVKAGPDVANFDQIQVGDKLKATLTDQLIIFVRKSTEPPTEVQATTVALAPMGAKPGAMMADTVEITGKVSAIDLKNHKATVELPDGTKKTFKVREDVDLSKQQVGEEVVFRSTETIALKMEKASE